MDKQIPIYFDSVTVSSPIEQISETNPNLGRLKVRVFTKFGNRNGSYITEAVANQIIESATNGMTPVIGFFDPDSQSWASHTGPKLANGYGYVESFLGWEPFTDTDGVTRDYAVFSVILFTKYFEEAKKILGENQSMELNPETIEGDWAIIDDQEYFVYTKAETLGLCVIGQHEPCFSMSAFFAKNDGQYKTQYEKFSSLLSDLKAQVEEADKNNKGGEQPMNDFENQVLANEEDIDSQIETPADDFSNPQIEEPKTEEQVEQFNSEKEEEVTNEFEQLQSKYNELENQYQDLVSKYENLEQEFNAFKETSATDMDALRQENEQLNTSIKAYQLKEAEILEGKKEELINKYSNILAADEINEVRENKANFSYEEIESKLAISFANKQISESKVNVIPLLEQEENSFASLMKNYKIK